MNNTLSFFTNLELAEKYHGSKLTFELLAEKLGMDKDDLETKVALGDMQADEILGIENDAQWELDDILPEVSFN